MVRSLRLHAIANGYLRRFPIVRKLKNGTRYRIVRLESFALALEMFSETNVLYPVELLPKDFTTFADLGCNVGYFSCWLADLARGRTLRGLMVDANPEAVEEANRNTSLNGLNQVHALNGIVGEGEPGGSAEFYVYESNICSTSHLTEEVKHLLAGKWKKISVPSLSIGEQWRQRFGDARCNVLKVDVEGSELKFFETEKEFLKKCDTVFVEWHKWAVQLEQLANILEECGLTYVKTIEENVDLGTAIFTRR